MLLKRISTRELVQAQTALLIAIGLQFIASHVSIELLPGIHYGIIIIELVLVLVLSSTAHLTSAHSRVVNHFIAVVLLALLSLANIGALISVLQSLIVEHAVADGKELLVSAIAIFLTNLIVFALWYWEIDSPGLTRRRWSKHDKDFQFTQQDMASEFPGWKPEFADYLFLSVFNAVNFAPADTKPLTRNAKMLMAAQSLVSVFTLGLLVARSVNILGS
jgi:uncharacterized membrane protein